VTTPTPRLLALSTAVPAYALGQEEVADRARRLFAERTAADLDRLMPVFANAGIERRYSCVPIDWYERPHGWTERNALYLENAVNLLERAARTALRNAELSPAEIDAVITISTTGIATPSLDAILMDRLELRRDVKRMPIFGLGCAGGVIGIARAADLARAAPGTRVLLLVVELCALSFRRNDVSKSNIVATALFGDGAAACVLRAGSEGVAEVTGTAEHTWPDSLDIMGWNVDPLGFGVIFDRSIPTFAEANLRPAMDGSLSRMGMKLADVDRFVCHPGGAKVIEALEKSLDLGQGALTFEREVLSDHGNMSAPTVLFVLERALAAGVTGQLVMTSLGPGFTASCVSLAA
jgi:alkylresorcinol/alkylpyrone synthase